MFERQSRLVQEARHRAGITQIGLYYKVYGHTGNGNAQSISNLERGVAGIPLDAMHAFCKALDIPKKVMIEVIAQDYKERLEGYFG